MEANFKLETNRLILRRLRNNDLKDLIEGVGELDVAKMTSNIPHPYKKSDADWFIKNAQKSWRDDTAYSFGIVLKSEGKLIGVIGLERIDKFVGTAMTGSWINKKYWRNGYITEAKIAANDFAFGTLRLRRLNSTVFTDNKASKKTQEKMGYVHEGTSRKDARSKATGKIHSHHFFGLLAEDWKRAREKLMKK